MLREDKYLILWSSWIDEEICGNIYDEDCNQCYTYDEDLNDDVKQCPYRKGCNLDYDFINMRISEEFNNKFGNNEHRYFVVGYSCDWYGGFPNMKPNMNGYSGLYDNIKEIISDMGEGVGICDFRIYKGKYNTVWIEISHHDGSQLYQLCRLNKQGEKYYNLNYNFDYRKHMITSVFKDFNYFKGVKKYA